MWELTHEPAVTVVIVVTLKCSQVLDCSYVLQSGYTALHKAAASGHLDVLELLINEGCDIDTQDDMVSEFLILESFWQKSSD